MKLHLPIGLRAALLAILLCSPMAMGNVSVYNVASDGTHKDVPLEDAGEGKATYKDGYWWSQEYVISVDGKTDGEHPFTQLECKALSSDCKTTITVGQGGALQFTDSGGSSIGDVFDGPSSETVVNIDGGTLKAEFSSLTLGAITEIAPKDAKTTVAITLENGGSLSMVTPSIGDIRRNTGSAPMGGTTTVSIEAKSGSTLELGTNQTGSIAYIENDGSKSVTTISIDGEGTTAQLYAMSIGCIGQRAQQNASSTTTLSVTDHAEFSMIHGGNIGCLEEYDSTAHTDIVVSGGASFAMGEEENTHLGRYSYETWRHSTTLQSYAGEVEMNISVTKGEGQEEGGHFTMKSGSIGWCAGIDSKTLGAAAAPKTSLTITVDGGAFSVAEDPGNAYPLIIGGVNLAYGTMSSVSGMGTNETTISVSNGGVFTIDCVKNTNQTNAGAFFLGQAHNTGAIIESYTLDVSENGKFIMTAANVTDDKTPGIAYLGYAYKGGTVKKLAINISTGGSLSIIPSASKAVTQRIGFAETAGSGEVSSITTEINLQDGGKMDIAAVKNDTAPSGIGDVVAKKGGTATANTSISVGGKDSSFTFTSGDIGMVYVDSTSTGTANTSITVEEGGTFTMTGGRLGYAYAASNDKGTVNQELSLKLNGGKMEIKGGSIFEKNANTASLSTRTGSIELSGDSVLTIDEGVTIGDGVEFAITMHGGTLAGDGISGLAEKVSAVTIDTGEGFKGTVNLGGLSGEKVSKVKINEAGATVTEIGGKTLTLSGQDNIITIGSGSAELTAGGETIASDEKDKVNIINFQEGDGTIQLGEGSTVTLRFGEDEFLGHLSGKENIKIQVHLANAKLLMTDGEVKKHFNLEAGWGLYVDSYEFDEDGNAILTLAGDTSGVVDLNGGQRDFSDLEDADKVIVTENTTLTSTEGGTLNRLTGDGDDDNLTITGKGEVELYNDGDLFNENGDTTFGGKLATEKDITLKKTGEDSLTLGSLEAEGNVAVEEGKLVLSGNDDSIGGELTLGDKGALQVDGKLTLSGTSDLSKDSDKLSGGGTIVVGDGGSLKLNSDVLTDENGLSFGATKGGRLEFTGETSVDLGKLTEDTAGTVAGSFESNNPDGTTFAGSVEGELTVKGGSLNMSNTENGGCDLVVGSGSSATLAAGSTYHSIDNNGTLSTSTSEETEDVRITATGDIIFRSGAHSPVRIDLSEPGLSQGNSVEEINYKSTGGKIIVEKHTELDVTLTGNILDAKGDLNVVIMEAAQGIENPAQYDEGGPLAANNIQEEILSAARAQEEDQVTAEAVVNLGKDVDAAVVNQLYDIGATTFWKVGNQLFTHIPQRTESPWEQYATTSNSRAGLSLLYRDLHQNGVMEADKDVVALIDGIDRLVQSNPAEARRALAAVAGSTLTSLSAAQSAALRNQMGRVRDHALQAGRLRCAGNDEATAQQRPCRNSHVWVEGTSFFSEQHSVGDESGYRLNSWGGAVGIDAQVDAHWSVGVSLSASYGDLEARAADYAKGDLDTYTVSFWSQAKNGRWGNTLLFTLGTNEAELKRTVNYGAGSYTATSNTSGSSLGAMWELTYDFHPVKDNKSNILQPLFNVAVMHTSMDGFSEKNAGNVGLTTEKQTRDTVTLGLGLRWLAAINSAKAVNRTVSTEVHANVAQDLGDRRSVANVALQADPNFTQRVYGSKTGSTAFQFGAGVNVPMTPNSQIYVNAGGELREHANAWNAALGVRMGF